MEHVFTASPRRTAAALGALLCALTLCTACVGSSTSNNAGGTSGTGGTGSTKASGTGTANANGTGSATGSGNGSGGSTGGGTSTGGSTGGGTSSGGGSSTGGGATGGSTGGGGGGLTTCSPRYLNASIGTSQGTAGSVYVNIVFKNLYYACTLQGYPGVSFGAGTPVTQVGQPSDHNPAVTPSVVVLQPQGYAHATLQIGDAGNYPASTCQPTPTTWLQVYAPNTSNQLYVQYSSTACAGNVVTLHVEAVQPGTGG